MTGKIYALLGIIGIALCGCKTNNDDDNVISQRYVHKYGYAVSKQEWDENCYPGQVVTSLNTGVTITATFENGQLEGPMTYTYPHSQTVEKCIVYNEGEKVKETLYDIMGMPVKEHVQISPTRYSLTMWYKEGCPMFVEEYANDELLEGQYFTTTNDTESRVSKGTGTRLLRDPSGFLVAKELIQDGYCVKKEAFYSCGTPESIAFYRNGVLNGEKRTFAQTGEPLSIEEWVNGELHGMATYFKNGNRFLEISYLHGQKNGTERHYIDGEIVSQEICWENDLKHGAATFYMNDKPTLQWFYAGEHVSRTRYDELNRLDQMISQISPE